METMKRRHGRIRREVLATAGVLALASSVFASVKTFSLLEKTRAADVILRGRVTQVSDDALSVAVESVLRGTVDGADIQLPLGRKQTVEPAPAVHARGDRVLIFAARSAGGTLRPIGGVQGGVPLRENETADHEHAIAKILQLESASGPEARTDILREMLAMDSRQARMAALEIAHLESHTRRFEAGPLVAPVLTLAEGSDRSITLQAVQALSRIGDKSAIPVLLRVMATHDARVADVAFRVFKNLTRADLSFDARQPAESRRAAVERMQQWWKQNKDRVVLVK
jgi:HEAT repeat protein